METSGLEKKQSANGQKEFSLARNWYFFFLENGQNVFFFCSGVQGTPSGRIDKLCEPHADLDDTGVCGGLLTATKPSMTCFVVVALLFLLLLPCVVAVVVCRCVLCSCCCSCCRQGDGVPMDELLPRFASAKRSANGVCQSGYDRSACG